MGYCGGSGRGHRGGRLRQLRLLRPGVYLAGENLVNEATATADRQHQLWRISEAENGATSNASFGSLYQQAVAEGISVFVAAGDEGAASCDAGQASATHGIGVSANAATQYNVAVGGTDFSDVLNGTTGTYWSQTNTATYGSALSYIPEIPWNDSCAGSLLAKYNGFSTGYGPGGFCSSLTNTYLQGVSMHSVAAGSGGPSNCFSGATLRRRWGLRRNLPGIRQAFVAGRSCRYCERRRARHPRCFHVRFGWRMGALCGCMLYRFGKRRSAMQGGSRQLGGDSGALPWPAR